MTVLDTAGDPIANMCAGFDQGWQAAVATDSTGMFHIAVDPGHAHIHLFTCIPDTHGNNTFEERGIDVIIADGRPTALTVHLRRNIATVTGIVRRLGGEPARDVCLAVLAGDWHDLITDNNGSFTLVVPITAGQVIVYPAGACQLSLSTSPIFAIDAAPESTLDASHTIAASPWDHRTHTSPVGVRYVETLGSSADPGEPVPSCMPDGKLPTHTLWFHVDPAHGFLPNPTADGTLAASWATAPDGSLAEQWCATAGQPLQWNMDRHPEGIDIQLVELNGPALVSVPFFSY